MVGCRVLPLLSFAASVEVEDAAAIALVDNTTTEIDCPTAMACGVTVVVA
jgi:hypothetical protein